MGRRHPSFPWMGKREERGKEGREGYEEGRERAVWRTKDGR